MEQGVMDSPVILIIKAPDQKYDDQTINCFLNWTVEKLKSHLSNVYPSKPNSKDQRLVYSGKLLQDHCKLRDVLRKQDEFHMLHLVCASRSPPPSPSTRRRNGGSSLAMNPNSLGSPAPSDDVQSSSSEENPASLSFGSSSSISPAPGSAWTQWFNQHRNNTNTPHYPMYNPHTLLWWQQLYTWQCHMTYQAWLASLRPRSKPPHLRFPLAVTLRPLTARTRGTLRSLQDRTRRTCIMIGWTGCTQRLEPSSSSASSISIHHSAGLSW
ncbi:hypothetical protein HF521_001681 [Silurus meridionalis]|uniref:Homocysteine-responsive endoplasmic reticulum-resident ubiquitin-like domain member 2 protein n=1 Tax=Silurus meridionalis TaxID=175797 RepID=A0A8T0BBZ8_SILME|nr:hypothetical protein HF521_001681 [Silurus meridionalis]